MTLISDQYAVPEVAGELHIRSTGPTEQLLRLCRSRGAILGRSDDTEVHRVHLRSPRMGRL